MWGIKKTTDSGGHDYSDPNSPVAHKDRYGDKDKKLMWAMKKTTESLVESEDLEEPKAAGGINVEA